MIRGAGAGAPPRTDGERREPERTTRRIPEPGEFGDVTDRLARPPDGPTGEDPGSGISRRDFLGSGGTALVAAAVVPAATRQAPAPPPAAEAQGQPAAGPPATRIRLTVNGREHELEAEDRWTLNELLRDHLGLTGPKLGCNRGECGACTVLLDGEPVYSCSTIAAWANGGTVVTVEGLERDGRPSTLQQAFMEHNAPQCGFCTPGQLISATALLERNPDPTAREVREALSGNLCRCSNYNAIVEAVLAAAGARATEGQA